MTTRSKSTSTEARALGFTTDMAMTLSHQLERIHGENLDMRGRIGLSVQPMRDTRARLRVAWFCAWQDRRWSWLPFLAFAWVAFVPMAAVCYGLAGAAQVMLAVFDLPVVVLQRLVR